MSTAMTDADRAIEFLRFLFGDSPRGLIATLNAKPGEAKPVAELDDYDEAEGVAPPPAKKAKEKPEMLSHAYSTPEKVFSEWWRTHSHQYNIWFCTATVKDRHARHNASNSLDVPALWFDIDAFKYFSVPGKAFYADIKSTEDVSAWVESSKDGLQGYYKLAEPFDMHGDAKLFKKELEPLLLDIALYFGADMEVCTPARLMRLPGTLNVKPEYAQPYAVVAHTCQDNTYSFGELCKKFKNVDQNTAPKTVIFGVTYVLQGSEIWSEGERHLIMMSLAGTVRKMGINKEACMNLFRALELTLGDDEFREADVESTYDIPELDKVRSLRSEYGVVADEIEEIIKYWVKLKKSYCKKKRLDFTPENYDPTRTLDPEDSGLFFERNMQTCYHGEDHDNVFSNFAIHLVGKLVKADTKDVVWLADVVTQGQPVKRVEITTASHNNWQVFSRIPHLPTGLTVFDGKMWPHYIAWLAQKCPEEVIKESTYYGWLEVGKKEPVLLLPNQPHDEYVWTRSNEDTACLDALKELENDEIVAYLERFGDCYSQYHEEHFIWPSLGWFAAAPMSAFFRQQVGGFPSLLTYGLAASGKSHLFEKVLGPHFGSQTGKCYDSTTIYAMKMFLVSNNLYPLIIDDFRDNPGPRGDDVKSRCGQLLSIIRAAWDGLETGSGKGDGTLRKDRFQAPLCIVGEHPISEDATMQRIFSITLNHDWLYDANALDTEERTAMSRRMRWLYDTKHEGWLGTIILEWTIKNLALCKTLMEQCLDKIEEVCPSEIPERKRHGFAVILYGLHTMRLIYEDRGLVFPLATKRFLNIIFAADPQSRKTNYGTSALTELFKATDSAIIMNTRRGTPLQGSVFVLDLHDRDIAYFDINRWRSEVRQFLGASTSAALLNDVAFHNLLKDCVRKADDPILGFPEDHPIFQEMCVSVNLARVRKQFGINTHQWSNNEPKFEEE
jgi:hypothetical protein